MPRWALHWTRHWAASWALATAASPAMALSVPGSFQPGSQPVVSPAGGQTVNAWRQTGHCGGISAVQISPRWILASGHGGNCRVGQVFQRETANGIVQATVDHTAVIDANDMVLSRLTAALPYDGSFVPLVEDIYAAVGANDQLQITDASRTLTVDADVLMSGYGQAAPAGGVLRVAWVPLGLFAPPYPHLPDPAPIDPHLPNQPVATNNDSGGAVFVVTPAWPQGALAGVMHRGSAGLRASKGIQPATRTLIHSTLQDPLLNPDADQVQWIGANQAVVMSSLPRPYAPLFLNSGGELDMLGIPTTGVLTSSTPGTLRMRLPAATRNDVYGTAMQITGYRLRMLHASHLSTPLGQFDVDLTVLPDARDLTLASGIQPGTWYMTLTTLAQDPVTGEQREGLSWQRTSFSIPPDEQRPGPLAALTPRYTAMDLEDGVLDWCADLTAVPGTGAAPDGVLWLVPGAGMQRTPIDGAGSVCSMFDATGAAAHPGGTMSVTAYPVKGAAIGPGLTLTLTNPRP